VVSASELLPIYCETGWRWECGSIKNDRRLKG